MGDPRPSESRVVQARDGKQGCGHSVGSQRTLSAPGRDAWRPQPCVGTGLSTERKEETPSPQAGGEASASEARL